MQTDTDDVTVFVDSIEDIGRLVGKFLIVVGDGGTGKPSKDDPLQNIEIRIFKTEEALRHDLGELAQQGFKGIPFHCTAIDDTADDVRMQLVRL